MSLNWWLNEYLNKLLMNGRNPASFDMVNIPLFTGFHTCRVVFSPDFWTIKQYETPWPLALGPSATRCMPWAGLSSISSLAFSRIPRLYYALNFNDLEYRKVAVFFSTGNEFSFPKQCLVSMLLVFHGVMSNRWLRQPLSQANGKMLVYQWFLSLYVEPFEFCPSPPPLSDKMRNP